MYCFQFTLHSNFWGNSQRTSWELFLNLLGIFTANVLGTLFKPNRERLLAFSPRGLPCTPPPPDRTKVYNFPDENVLIQVFEKKEKIVKNDIYFGCSLLKQTGYHYVGNICLFVSPQCYCSHEFS